MSIFASDAFAQWLRVILFWIGAGLLLVGILAATWHFRPRGWFARNVRWRFRKSPPHEQSLADRLGRDGSFVKLSETKHNIKGGKIVYEAGLEFLRDVRNVAVVVETLVAETNFGGCKWRRVRQFTQARADRNRGEIEQVHLIELRAKHEGEEPPFDNGHIFGGDQARLKVRLTVTAAERSPFIEERLFLWKGNTVFPMPLSVPHEEGSDSIDFEEGQCVLWARM